MDDLARIFGKITAIAERPKDRKHGREYWPGGGMHTKVADMYFTIHNAISAY